MLENENGLTTAESTPQPPVRRRRAASRPAGPPPEGTAPAEAPQTAAPQTASAKPDAVAVTEAPAAEATKAPQRTRRATRAAAPAPEAAETVPPVEAPAATEAKAPARTRRAPAKSRANVEPAAEAAPAPENVSAAAEAAPEKPTRSRRATRAAAPSSTVRDSDETPARVVSQEAPVASAPVASAPDTVTDAPVAEEKPATRRRRASRPAAAPVADAPVAEAAAQQAPAEQAPVDQTPPAQAPAPEIAAETKPATRRRRATRPAAPAEPSTSESSDVSAALDALTAHVASSTSEATPAPAAAPTSERSADERPSRRRRATRAAAPAAPVPFADDSVDDDGHAPEMDGISAALRMAEDAARSRRALVADPFRVTAESRQVHLDRLAQSIASGEDDEDDEDSDDETDDVEDDTQDTTGDTDSDDSDDSDDDDDADEGSDDDTNDADGDDRGKGRRRRRGGRRRRRGGSNNRDDATSEDRSEGSDDKGDDDDAGSGSDDVKPAGDDHDEDTASEDDSDNGDGSDSGTTRRRRRRRRSGNETSDSSRSTGDDAITGIEGSTRMEAKRQRRRENRAAGRRRAPILSEAEFLARRESVDRKLVIRQGEDYTQLAVIEDNILVEHYVDRASAMSLIGNVYLAKVQNVLPSMEAAFLDIGRGRNAVLYAGEVDWSGFHVSAEDRKVEKVFKSGQTVLVQVTKDPVGAKGARLTGHISLPGRYVVYSPGGHLSGISRKLPDSERSRLREILGELISDSESVIVRTAAEGASSEELVRDVNRLKAQWEIIEKKSKQGTSPAALYSEPDLTLRIVRDLFTEDFGALVVQGNGGAEDSFDEINAYVAHVAPNLADRVQRYEIDQKGHDSFAEYKIDEQIARALDRKVFLPSGGSLVIDRTEAMTVIDVNTGRFTGAGGNLEATVTSNNLEAAEEVVRQLRLRDIGGIIVVDFIDMVLPSNRDLLLRRLVECLSRDRTRHQVAEVTSLGLVQLTRKKIGTGLAEAFTEECEHCHGDGYNRFQEPVDSQAPSDGGDRSAAGGSSHGGGNRSRSGRGRRGGNGHSTGEKKSD